LGKVEQKDLFQLLQLLEKVVQNFLIQLFLKLKRCIYFLNIIYKWPMHGCLI